MPYICSCRCCSRCPVLTIATTAVALVMTMTNDSDHEDARAADNDGSDDEDDDGRPRRKVAGPLPAALACASLILLQHVPLAQASKEADRPYRYMSYLETMRYFEDLKRRCPDIVDTWIAQDDFPAIHPGRKAGVPWATCEGVPCQTLVVRIASRRNLTSRTPEVFFSGALHGDERIGRGEERIAPQTAPSLRKVAEACRRLTANSDSRAEPRTVADRAIAMTAIRAEIRCPYSRHVNPSFVPSIEASSIEVSIFAVQYRREIPDA